jgi:hypothetical protein
MKIRPVEAGFYDAYGRTEEQEDRNDEAILRKRLKCGNVPWYMRNSSFPQLYFQDSGVSYCKTKSQDL